MELIGKHKLQIHISKETQFVILMAAISLLFFAPPSFSHAFVRSRDMLTDFRMHRILAAALQQHGLHGIPASDLALSAWQWLLIILNTAFGVTLNQASFLGALISWALAAAILAGWFFPTLSRLKSPLPINVLLILAVSIAAPVALLWPLDGLLYMGYVGITSYHNPTIILLKPFALLQFIYAGYCLTAEVPVSKGKIFTAALVSLLGTFVKPSLAICLLPALGLIVIIRWAKKKSVDWLGLILGIAIPTVLVLAWQFLSVYSANETDSIKISPFMLASYYSGFLGIKFVLSILFPLCLAIALPRQVFEDYRMLLAWSTFIFGAAYSYFLVEAGPRVLDGNFTWSAEISLFLLFVVSTLFFLENRVASKNLSRLLYTLWIMQVGFGIMYYATAVLNRPYF